MLEERKVLDKGYVRLLNISGPTRRAELAVDALDTDPASTARVSFDAMEKDRTMEDDLKLCDYLMRNWHTTPFEMIEVWLEMKLPIFVARQFVRHRTCTINEVSGRYVELPDDWYLPEKVYYKPANAKQGRGREMGQVMSNRFRCELNSICNESHMHYLSYMDSGVAPEIARNFLHLNHYTKWVWKQDLHNMFHFLSLREDEHAQWEARQYAVAIKELLRGYLPRSIALYEKYRTFK